MHVLPTLGVFLALLALLVVVRLNWSRIPPRIQSILIVLSLIALAVQGLSSATKWATTVYDLNIMIRWSAVAAYEFIVILLTLLRPRWLTIIIAIILIVPLLSASLFLPLAPIFDHSPHRIDSVSDTLITETTSWYSVSQGASGVDIDLFQVTPYLPFLRHTIAGTRLFNSQCDAAGARVLLLPDRASVLFHCPAWPSQTNDGPRDYVLHLQ
jgi:hypothetical protein